LLQTKTFFEEVYVHAEEDDRPLLIEVLEASKVFGNSSKPLRKMANPVFA